ncbi:MAG: hypothetical protein WBC06_17225, partial [Chitinophagaceae bacterium]
MMTKYLILFSFFTVLWYSSPGQLNITPGSAKAQPCKPPKNRELFHDFVDNQQISLFKADGKADKQFTPSANEEINFLLNQSATSRIDALQCVIETDTLLNDQVKKKYLRGLEYLIRFFVSNIRSKKVNPLILPDILTAYEKCYHLDKKGLPIDGIIKGLSYEAAYTVINADNSTFIKNPGYLAGKQTVILKYCNLYPGKIFSILRDNPNMPFADSLVRTVAKKYPKQLYDYSQANNNLGFTIRNITDDEFIKTIVKMARTKDGQQYFCFLDNIINGRLTYQQIDSAKNDSVLYYRLLVKTQIDYAERAQKKDTAFEFALLTERLKKKAAESFVNVINGLHTERNQDIRFRNIQELSPQELYYLAVTSDGSMYTSSFVKGV